MRFTATYTDTFGGEPNFSWARKASFEAPESASNALLVRRAKRALGLSGPHKTEDWGDTIALRLRGECTIVFVEIEEVNS